MDYFLSTKPGKMPWRLACPTGRRLRSAPGIALGDSASVTNANKWVQPSNTPLPALLNPNPIVSSPPHPSLAIVAASVVSRNAADARSPVTEEHSRHITRRASRGVASGNMRRVGSCNLLNRRIDSLRLV